MNSHFKILLCITQISGSYLMAGPELIDPKSAEVPFAGEPFVGNSLGGEGYQISVTKNTSGTSLVASRNATVVAQMILPSLNVHSMVWVDRKCWFILRKDEKYSSGAVIALALFDPNRKDSKFLFFSREIGRENNGWIFYLDGAKDGGVVARCGMRDPRNKNGRIDYISGYLPQDKMVQLTKKEMEILKIPSEATVTEK